LAGAAAAAAAGAAAAAATGAAAPAAGAEPNCETKSATLTPSKAEAKSPGQYGATSYEAALSTALILSPFFLLKKICPLKQFRS
jgi:hypothetical protein